MNSPDSLRTRDAGSSTSFKHTDTRKDSAISAGRRPIVGAASADFSRKGPSPVINERTFSDAGSRVEEHVNMPSCPDEYLSFIENTSLERLVFWKLERLIDSLPIDAVEGVELNVLDKVVTNVEKPLFALVLRKTSGNLSTAAKFLGCNRNTLHRKLREFSIVPKDLRKLLRRGRVHKLAGLNE